MNNIWQEYRPRYTIEEGDNIYLKSIVTAGYPIDIDEEKFQIYSTFIRTLFHFMRRRRLSAVCNPSAEFAISKSQKFPNNYIFQIDQIFRR